MLTISNNNKYSCTRTLREKTNRQTVKYLKYHCPVHERTF